MNENSKAANRVNKTEGLSSLHAVAEDILAQKLADITTMLNASGTGRSKLYEDVTDIVERCLFRIALQRSHGVKSRAADYLGINRNTFQKKMTKLGIDP